MSAKQTLVLGQSEIARSMPLKDYIEAVDTAFARYYNGGMALPDVVHIAAPDGAVHVKSAAYVGDPPYAAVKVNANFPRKSSAQWIADHSRRDCPVRHQ